MHNLTRRSLQDFDNQHEFERLAADVLNSLGFSDVEPIAPLGGADGGKDMKFRDGEIDGISFVTLRKDIHNKFKEDLGKLSKGTGKIALFCNVDITPKKRIDFSRDALAKGYALDIYDLERIRSLFDSTLTEQRRRYLGIDDSETSILRKKLYKLLQFPNTIRDEEQSTSILEELLIEKRPERLFKLLLSYDTSIIKEMSVIGDILYNYILSYYSFQNNIKKVEEEIILKIGTVEPCQFRNSWIIQYTYTVERYSGSSIEDIKRQGNFLNYGITWDSAEVIFNKLQADGLIDKLFPPIFDQHQDFIKTIDSLLEINKKLKYSLQESESENAVSSNNSSPS